MDPDNKTKLELDKKGVSFAVIMSDYNGILITVQNSLIESHGLDTRSGAKLGKSHVSLML
jgi:hypothetical protein